MVSPFWLATYSQVPLGSMAKLRGKLTPAWRIRSPRAVPSKDRSDSRQCCCGRGWRRRGTCRTDARRFRRCCAVPRNRSVRSRWSAVPCRSAREGVVGKTRHGRIQLIHHVEALAARVECDMTRSSAGRHRRLADPRETAVGEAEDLDFVDRPQRRSGRPGRRRRCEDEALPGGSCSGRCRYP